MPNEAEMTIVATILTGDSAGLIGDAVGSVAPWVDLVLLIDTGIADATREIAEERAGAKLRVVSFPWCRDFARTRNFGLLRAGAAVPSVSSGADREEKLQ
jgi:hypothetical protein